MNTIYLDMDGVLADFESKYREITGLTDYENINWEALGEHRPLMYSILEPMNDAKELVDGVLEIVANNPNFKVAILTAIPQKGDIPLAEQHKREWIDKHFPELSEVFNIGPYARDKQLWCKHRNDILIDDYLRNIKQWMDAGGIGILHTEARLTLNWLKDVLKYEIN